MSDDQISNDQHFAMDLVAGAQRADTNDRLKDIESLLIAQQKKKKASCPYCDGDLTKIGVELCKHCGSKLTWFRHIVVKNGELEKAKQKFADYERGLEQAAERHRLKLKREQEEKENARKNLEGCAVVGLVVALVCVLFFLVVSGIRSCSQAFERRQQTVTSKNQSGLTDEQRQQAYAQKTPERTTERQKASLVKSLPSIALAIRDSLSTKTTVAKEVGGQMVDFQATTTFIVTEPSPDEAIKWMFDLEPEVNVPSGSVPFKIEGYMSLSSEKYRIVGERTKSHHIYPKLVYVPSSDTWDVDFLAVITPIKNEIGEISLRLLQRQLDGIFQNGSVESSTEENATVRQKQATVKEKQRRPFD